MIGTLTSHRSLSENRPSLSCVANRGSVSLGAVAPGSSVQRIVSGLAAVDGSAFSIVSPQSGAKLCWARQASRLSWAAWAIYTLASAVSSGTWYRSALGVAPW